MATEAYLNTARSRASVRRHARLVDYAMHDGASARTWLVFETDVDRGNVAAPAVPKQTLVMAPATETQPALAFETVHAVIELRVSRNAIQFYTWSDANCCLPSGATRATLRRQRRAPRVAQGRCARVRGGARRRERIAGRRGQDPPSRRAPGGGTAGADRSAHADNGARHPLARRGRAAVSALPARIRRAASVPASRAAMWRSPTTGRRLCPRPPATI